MTRAERTNFAETSSYDDVVTFLAALDERGAPIVRGSLGKSPGGREIPYVIASRPLVRTPGQARQDERPIVMIQANIHGGEVEGKEAVLAVLRDLTTRTDHTILEDMVLLIVPIYNVDGNEKLGPQRKNRSEQNGPALVGTRENGAGLDLNRDYVKAEAPETRGALALINAWDPDVFIDLHATDGSFHNFGLTYAPSLHPAAFYGGVYARDHLLPDVRKSMSEKFSIETFDYGNFGRKAAPNPGPGVEPGWYTYDYRPRYGTNYVGLRGRIAILSEAYSHDSFERRVFVTRAFLETTLAYVSDKSDEILNNSRVADRWVSGSIPIRAAFPAKAPRNETISWETLVLEPGPTHEPGVPEGYRRSGKYGTAIMPVYDRFVGTRYVDQPKGYLVPYEHAKLVLPLLARHGIFYETLLTSKKYKTSEFVVTRVDRAAQPFEGHRLATPIGKWRDLDYVAHFGAVYIPGTQPLGVLATVLLEPESDDGFFSWNVFDAVLKPGQPAPVRRIH